MFSVQIPTQVPAGASFAVSIWEHSLQWQTVNLALLNSAGQPIQATFLDMSQTPVTQITLIPGGQTLLTCNNWAASQGDVLTVSAYTPSNYAGDQTIVI